MEIPRGKPATRPRESGGRDRLPAKELLPAQGRWAGGLPSESPEGARPAAPGLGASGSPELTHRSGFRPQLVFRVMAAPGS